MLINKCNICGKNEMDSDTWLRVSGGGSFIKHFNKQTNLYTSYGDVNMDFCSGECLTKYFKDQGK